MLFLMLLITTAASHRVIESIEDVPPEDFKSTVLVPVNKTSSEIDNSREKIKISDATIWKLDTAFAESDFDKKIKNATELKEEKEEKREENKTDGAVKEFKPSPHLGTIFEDEGMEVVPTRATIGDFKPLKKPPTGFGSFPNDRFKSSFFSSPKDVKHQHDFPYKIESSIYTKTKDWRPDTLDSRPTVEVPMRVPAGGLYRSPDAFKEKPGVAGDSEDFGLDFEDVKDNSLDVKKRVNPWKNLLRLVTAFIPVGLIISALTPSIITVEPTGPGNQYPAQFYRRSDSAAELAPISEPCRRRLLCELHSDNNYTQGPQSGRARRARQCHRLRCEDPQALSDMLQWLLTRHQHNHN